jgi:pimeloyl-ACP methyl ester carboxylesterase
MSVVLIDRQVVHYEVLGRGRPLIFLHGWVGSWRYWIPVMQAASISYRAYALDLWGFGDTARHPANYSLDHQLELVDAFLFNMGIGRVALVGHGLGAALALLYARRNPDVVDRVLAVSCPLEESSLSGRLRGTLPVDLAGWLLGKSPLAEPVLTDAPKTDPQALAAALAGVAGAKVKEAADSLGTSRLFVNGQNDPAILPLDLDQIASLPESAHAILFEQSGHFPMLDESSKFNRLLVDFLSLASGESPRQLQLKEEWKRRVR